MNKTRILYIIASSQIGGAENFIYTLLRHIDNTRFEKYIICPEGGYYSERFRALANKALFINPKRSFMNPATILQTSSFVKDNNIDILHTMLYTSDFCGITACLFSGRPRVLNTINGFNFLVVNKGTPGLKRRVASFIYRFIYRYSDKVLAVSESVKQDLINRRGIKISPEKIETVLAAGTNISYDDFPEDDIAYLRTNYLTDKELAVSAIGTLEEVKDYDTMLEAFSIAVRKNPALKLLIAGDGPERSRLQTTASNLGLGKRICFLGALEEKKKNALLSLTDIFVMSSVSEGCPTALLEAMYFEKPVIATRVGGIPEIVRDGETGLLVPERDAGQMADSIFKLAQDREKRIQFGKKARQVFDERFSQRHMLKAYENIYNNLLKN